MKAYLVLRCAVSPAAGGGVDAAGAVRLTAALHHTNLLSGRLGDIL